MTLYSSMKAGYLKKKPGLALETDISEFDENRWRYLNEHGVRAGVKIERFANPAGHD